MTPVPFDSVRFLPCGDTGLCVEFGSIIDRPTSARVVALGKALDHAALPGVQETVPTYRSLMVHYDPLQTTAETLESQIRTLLKRDGETTPGREGTSWRLPVCFDGPDLEAVASWGNMTPEDLVAILTSTPLHVYMLGFAPGQPYLGDLPQALDIPRRETPIPRIEAGSVVVATGKVTLYPIANPTGWHVVGRTPVSLFDPSHTPPGLLAAGDTVTFEAVDAQRYDALLQEASAS